MSVYKSNKKEMYKTCSFDFCLIRRNVTTSNWNFLYILLTKYIYHMEFLLDYIYFIKTITSLICYVKEKLKITQKVQQK